LELLLSEFRLELILLNELIELNIEFLTLISIFYDSVGYPISVLLL